MVSSERLEAYDLKFSPIKYWLLFIGVLCGPHWAISQSTKLDSLTTLLANAESENRKKELLLYISEYHFNKDMMVSMEYVEKAIDIAQKTEMDLISAKAYLHMANIYLQLGNYPVAIKYYHQVIQDSENIEGGTSLIGTAYGNIGSIYYYQKDRENALKFYRKALENFEANHGLEKRKKFSGKSSLLNNIGIIYEESKKLDSAEIFYQEAFQYSVQANDTTNMANILNNQGTIFRDRGDMESAFKYYQEAMELRQLSKNKTGIVRSYHNLGEFYLNQLKNYPKAEEYLKQAISHGTEIRSWHTVSSSSNLLYQLYKDQNQFQEALEALELHQQISDSLFSEETTSTIAQLEMQFEFDRVQSQKEAEQKERELYFWMSASGLLLLLIIVTLLYFLQKSKTRRSQLEQAHLELEKANLKSDLAIKDKELATNIMYLINKNELINEISEKLLDVKHHLQDDSQQTAVQKILMDLQSNLQPELWNEFEYRFQQVHEQFYTSLNERFPDLSPSERRLCAFLKLNMTTKEISAITHQNAKSIDVARTRLRKKLNLTGTDQNLVTFLEQLGNLPQ